MPVSTGTLVITMALPTPFVALAAVLGIGLAGCAVPRRTTTFVDPSAIQIVASPPSSGPTGAIGGCRTSADTNYSVEPVRGYGAFGPAFTVIIDGRRVHFRGV